ncbi:hypothetical protein ABE430_20390 [Brevibacillus agri]|uniref:hypothetical protein n=1 Tax=Brevibacillus agri TaxID=51101 RepID=UPI003D1FE951
MELDRVNELIETTAQNEVNQKLKNGWILLSVASGNTEEGYPVFRYALGWVHNESEQEYLKRRQILDEIGIF